MAKDMETFTLEAKGASQITSVYPDSLLLTNFVDSLLKRMVQMVRWACWYPLSATDPSNVSQIWKITCYV